MKTQDADSEKYNEALYRSGMRYCADRNWDKAVETFEKLRKRDPNYENLSRSLWKARIRRYVTHIQDLINNILPDWLSLKRPTSRIAGGVVIIVIVALCLACVVGVVKVLFPKIALAPTKVAIATTVVPTVQTLPPSPPLTPTVIQPTSPPPEPTATFTSEPPVTLMPEMATTPSETPTREASPTPTSLSTPTQKPQPEPPPTSPLSGQIAFPVYDTKHQTYDIYLANTDGSNRQRVVGEASEPAISPDGSKIAFRSWNASTLGLMVRNIDGTQPQRVSRGLEDACPYWALGESLVFHSTKEGPAPRLYTAGTWGGANGFNNVQDVKRGPDPVHGQYPAWVPDGRIVYKYFDQRGNYRGLYVMNSDGSNPMPITDDIDDTMPSVSASGDKVAFMSKRTGKWEVYVVNTDGSGLRQLTDSRDYNSGLPTWSPDGRHIAFVSDRDSQWAIWVINCDGSGERNLFDLGGTLEWGERSISWGP